MCREHCDCRVGHTHIAELGTPTFWGQQKQKTQSLLANDGAFAAATAASDAPATVTGRPSETMAPFAAATAAADAPATVTGRPSETMAPFAAASAAAVDAPATVTGSRLSRGGE